MRPARPGVRFQRRLVYLFLRTHSNKTVGRSFCAAVASFLARHEKCWGVNFALRWRTFLLAAKNIG